MAQAVNTATVAFPTPTGLQADPTQVVIMSAMTAGEELWRDALDADVNAPDVNDMVRFLSGQLLVAIPDSGNATNAGAQRAVRGLLDGTVYLGLLDDSNSELSGNGYARVAMDIADWTIT